MTTQRCIRLLVLSALTCAALPSLAAADSVAASYGNTIIAADRSCLLMRMGTMTNTCDRNIDLEFALPVRSDGLHAVEIAVPASFRDASCRVYGFSRTSERTNVAGRGLTRIEGEVAILRFGNVPSEPGFTLNAACVVPPGKMIRSVYWDA
jgi:hypothetical protein